MLSKINSRKFLTSIFVIIAAIILLLFGKISEDTWAMVVIAISTGYSISNVISKKYQPPKEVEIDEEE